MVGVKAGVRRLRFDRNEFAGAFGDIGTDFPLIAGLILVAGLDPASVLIMFGAMQLLTGLTYGIPMPAQPLKAMAALTISQGVAADTLYGAGLAIGICMLLLAATGAIDRLATAIPKPVVRGIQIGLALQLARLALFRFIPDDGASGIVLAVVCAALAVALLGNRKMPPALILIGLGLAYASATDLDVSTLAGGLGLDGPQIGSPGWDDLARGFVVLTIAQLPLSLGNSILATHRLAHDLFPEKGVTVRKLSFTYAAMNLVNPFFGGVPTCHGSGGLVGHHAFGARTGGSVVLYGSFFLAIGLFASGAFGEVVLLFPLPVLGVMLVVEALSLLRLARDSILDRRAAVVAVTVGLTAAFVPYGYAIGLVVGTLAYRALIRDRSDSGAQ